MSSPPSSPPDEPPGPPPSPSASPTPPAPTVWYARVVETPNGVALAALVVGILSVVLFPVGLLLGIIAVTLGILGLARAGNLPIPYNRRGMARAGIVLGVGGLVVGALAILMPSLNSPGMPRRSVCAANLRGIGQGMKVYSNDNEDWWPIASSRQPDPHAPDVAVVSFIGAMGGNSETQLTSGNDSFVHPSRSLFKLIVDGTCTAGQFICPDSKDVEDDLRNQRGGMWVASQPGINRFDFKGYPHLSYGYQLPFGPKARPSENLDARMAIAADKGPFFKAGAPRKDGTVPDEAAVPPGTGLALSGVSTSAEILKLENDAWRPYNSRNHKREGQNVLFVDAHVEFVKRPIVGVDHDNIYTMQGPGYTLLDSLLGRVPADLMGPLTNTDSVIVP